jgi:hypothetical protein
MVVIVNQGQLIYSYYYLQFSHNTVYIIVHVTTGKRYKQINYSQPRKRNYWEYDSANVSGIATGKNINLPVSCTTGNYCGVYVVFGKLDVLLTMHHGTSMNQHQLDNTLLSVFY